MNGNGGLVSWYLAVWKKYAVFTGRARRKEYWFFYLFNLIAAFILAFIDGGLGFTNGGGRGPFYTIYVLASLLPYICVGIRRMHDSDHRGWWLLFPIVNLILLISDSTPGSNRFGPNPKAPEVAYAAASVPAGWLPDPTGRHQYRYWDAERWTSSVSDDGVPSVD